MGIDIKELDKCPVLTDYEKDLIRRIDVNHETQASVAKHYGKSPSTINIQFKKAVKKYLEWKEKSEVPHPANLDKYVFGRLNHRDPPWMIIADIGQADKVIDLSEKWRRLHAGDYWTAMNHLKNNGILYEVDEQEEKPLTKAVIIALDMRAEAQCKLEDAEEEKKTHVREIRQIKKQLRFLSNELDAARSEITGLERLKQYEELSEEKRQALQLQIDLLKRIIRELAAKVEELQRRKTILERELNTIEQVKADVERDIQGSILEYIGNLSLSDVLKLYNKAVVLRIHKQVIAQ